MWLPTAPKTATVLWTGLGLFILTRFTLCHVHVLSRGPSLAQSGHSEISY